MNHDSDRNDNWKQKYGAKGESLDKELSIAADYSANLSTPQHHHGLPCQATWENAGIPRGMGHWQKQVFEEQPLKVRNAHYANLKVGRVDEGGAWATKAVG